MRNGCLLACFACLLLLPSMSWADQSKDVETLLADAARASALRKHDEAVKHLTAAIALDPKNALAHYLRGREQFRLGKIDAAVADFDRGVELSPVSERSQWERGIAYYYAGLFEKGAKQFADYQKFHDQDVENSAWRYLCVARTEGVEKARETLLPIEHDPRVPMMKIHALYAGKATPEVVLNAANAGMPSKEALNTRLFYAHLYIGLWHEAAGDHEQARHHILEAEKHRIGHYMWDVAHIHADRLRKAQAEAGE